MQVKWTRKALVNLDNAIEYIAGDDPTASHNAARKIWESSQMLAFHPALGRPGRVSGTRELVISGLPYILPYIQKGDTIYILRLMHSSMIWPAQF